MHIFACIVAVSFFYGVYELYVIIREEKQFEKMRMEVFIDILSAVNDGDS